MKCDQCRKRQATVHLTLLEDERAREHHLCETCAKNHSMSSLFVQASHGVKHPDALICPSCRHMNQPNWNFCSACGAKRDA